MSSVVHVGVVLLLVIFSMWSRLQHLDEKEGQWETKVSPSCIILCVFIMLILTKFSVLLCCLQHLEEDEDEWETNVTPLVLFCVL